MYFENKTPLWFWHHPINFETHLKEKKQGISSQILRLVKELNTDVPIKIIRGQDFLTDNPQKFQFS